MAVTYTNLHRTVPALETTTLNFYHPGLVRWLGWDANNQKLYTSRQAITQWWPGGCTTTAGTLGETYFGQWVLPVPVGFSRLIVEANGYAVAAGGTQWRLYSGNRLYTGAAGTVPAVTSWTIVSAAESWSSPVFLDFRTSAAMTDGRRLTYLWLTGENLSAVAQGRLWTMHVRPAPDTPP